MADLSPAARQAALGNLDAAAEWLQGMSEWADGDSPERERCAIALEDASKAVMVASWLLERADRTRLAELTHRRMAQPAADGPQGMPQPYQSQYGA